MRFALLKKGVREITECTAVSGRGGGVGEARTRAKARQKRQRERGGGVGGEGLACRLYQQRRRAVADGSDCRGGEGKGERGKALAETGWLVALRV